MEKLNEGKFVNLGLICGNGRQETWEIEGRDGHRLRMGRG